MNVARRYKTECGVLAAYFLMAAAVTFPLILKLGSGIYGSFFNTDMRGSLWSVWWLRYALENRLDYFTCPLIAAPFGVDFSGMPLFGILFAFGKSSLSVMTPEVYMNVYTLLFLTLSAYGTWLIARHQTGSSLPSFLAGCIFAFSPYHLNKLWEFGFIYLGVWLVFYVASLLWLRERPALPRTLLCAVAFALLLSFNAYYAFFAVVLTATLCLFWWAQAIRDRKTGVSSGGRVPSDILAAEGRFLLYLLAAFAVALLINAPTLVAIASNLSRHAAAPTAAADTFIRPIKYLFSQSARPLSYLLPAATHPVFGDFTRRFFGTWWYGRNTIEHTLYLGWIPLFFAWRAARVPVGTGESRDRKIGKWIWGAWAAFFFSLPPFLNLGLFKVPLPSGLAYKVLPMFRAYARFGVIVILCISILAAFGLKAVLGRFPGKKTKILFTAAVLFGIMFEFTNMPPFRVTDISHTPAVYAWLKQQPETVIVAEYPMTKGSAGEAYVRQNYLFSQTKHGRRLVNGALPGSLADRVKRKILIVEDPRTPRILAALGTRYVLLHRDTYRENARVGSTTVIGDVPDLTQVPGYDFVRRIDDVDIFQVSCAPLPWTQVISPDQTRGDHET